MKLGMAVADNRKILAASIEGNVFDLSSTVHAKDLIEVIHDWGYWKQIIEQAISTAEHFVPDAIWSSPLPNPPKFLLLAGNFHAHVIESGFDAAPEKDLTPQFFMKPSTAIVGPADDIPLTHSNHALDYEAELAVVIGKRMRNATSATAMDAVWGYTVVNDVSERKLNADMTSRKKRSNDDFYDWLVGKWFDGSAPMGPFVVTADEISNDLVIRSRLNGETVQEAPASAMIHTVCEAIVYISKVLTLEPGDVIAMGTPAGVGAARGRLLQDGDVIECEVSGIGILRNRVAQQ